MPYLPSPPRLLCFAALLALSACDQPASPTMATATPVPSASASASASGGGAGQAALEACKAQIARLGGLPALPGAPGFEAKRAEILGRAKGEAVVYVRTPQPEQELTPRLSLMRANLGKRSPILSYPGVLEQLRYSPEDARKIFLSQGYVYAESPEVASVMIDVLKLPRLFREREVWLARGASISRLERDKQGVYRYAEGEQQGEEASLLLGDRVGLSRAELTPLLHRDLGAIADEHAPDRVRITRMTAEGAIAELRYGDAWVPAALSDDGQRYAVSCLATPEALRERVEAARQDNLARAGSAARVREAVRAMVDERLRFDEPLEEVGQQDGSLRPLWKWAYDHGASSYSFNGVGYRVFDLKGRPSPPQVCIDFVLDAYERASGSWYHGEDRPRERTSGAIDFDASDLRNRRSAAEFVAFAGRHPEMFELWALPDEERVPFGRRGDFFRYIVDHADRFHAGDTVVIHGFKPDGLPHYHSFLIDAVDPVTGFPFRLAGNAGRPRLQSWEGVMRSAPLRSIRYTVSPRSDWLRVTLPPRAPSLAQRAPG